MPNPTREPANRSPPISSFTPTRGVGVGVGVAAPGAAVRLEEHAQALELLADLVRALPEEDERLLLPGTLVVRGGQFAPGRAGEHALTQFGGTSRKALTCF
jgi:hypothetical protein